jgi:hypothetical protein
MIINSITCQIQAGITPSENSIKSSVVQRTYVDGSFDFISFGARKERVVEFTIINISKTNSISLTNYFLANAGSKILLTIENSGEELFPEYSYPTYSTYYVYLLEPFNFQTEDFTVDDSLYSISLRVAFAGTGISDVPNPIGTSTIDFLLKIDTALADYNQSTAPVAPTIGERWLDTDDFKLYAYRNSAWKYIYTIPADDPVYGLVRGIFYLSSFASLTYFGNLYIAGHISEKGITFPSKSINLNEGPSIANREGFRFSIANNSRFYKFIIDTGFNLYGAEVELGIISSGTYSKEGSGKIRNMRISYMSYEIQVDPYSLNPTEKFPAEELSADDSRYTDTKEEFLGQPIYVTYGEHEVAALQNISTVESFVKPVRYPPTIATFPAEEVESIACRLCYGYLTKIFIRKISNAIENYYEFTTAQLALINSGVCALNVLDDSHTASTNPKKIRKINSISSLNTTCFIGIAVNYITVAYPAAYIWVPDTVDLSAADSIIGGTLTISSATNPGNNGNFIILGYSNTTGLKYISVTNASGVAENPSPAACTVYGTYYVLTLEDALPDNPTYNGNVIWPSTDDVLHISIIENIYKFQIDEEICGGFGTLNSTLDSWIDGALDIRKFDSTQRELEALMGVGFSANADDNMLTLDPAMTNQDSNVPQYSKITNVLMKGHLNESPALNISTFMYDFSGLNVPVSPPWTGYKAASDGISARIPNIYSIYNGGSMEAISQGSLIPNPLSNGDSYLVRSAIVINADSVTYPDMLKEKSCIVCFKIPVRHTPSRDTILSGQTDVRLAMKLSINSYLEMGGGNDAANRKYRCLGAGCQVGVRFRRFDGTFIYNPANLHEFSSDELGITFSGKSGIGNLEINNKPDVSNLGFGDETVLTSNYTHVILINATSAPASSTILTGDKYWNTTTGKLYTWDGSTWGSGEIVVNGTLIYRMWSSAGVWYGAMYKVQAGTPQTLVDAVDGADYTSTPKFRGKDLFDVSAAFTAGVWAEVESLELFIMNEDFSNPHINAGFALFSAYKIDQMTWFVNLTLDSESPMIYIGDEIEIEDVPLFAGCRGRKIDGSYSSYASKITEAILDEIYPNKYSTTALSTLFSGDRSSWKFRRQFTESYSVDEVLKELLKNLWACAYIDRNDELVVKSLKDEALYSATVAFSDVDIIADSISTIDLRESSEIFQDFVLQYDYYIPSEFSKAIQQFRKSIKATYDSGDIGMQAILNKSKNLYNLTNKYREEFKYHYNNLPIAQWVIEYFAFDTWSFKFQTKLESVIGANYLDIASRIKIKDWFHTNNVDLYGLVNYRDLSDAYNGIVTIGVFVPAPIGQLGPLHDPFNDALNLETRVITGWTNANGRRNDAGDLVTRVIGGYTQKDAGSLVTRTFD